jgi:ATPase subunit of ABC transporter with duplicated ATPase domains
MITVNDISVQFGGTTLLATSPLLLMKMIRLLMGGAGKSTLLKLLLGKANRQQETYLHLKRM